MNKEFLVTLLEKDIRELELLTEGFEDLEVFPKPILLLARQKAENIIKNLSELESLTLKKEIKPAENVKVTTVIEEEPSNNNEKLPATDNDADILVEPEKEILEISETEEIVEDESAEFIEDIKEYGIQDKTIVESIEEEPIIEEIEEKIPEIEIAAEEIKVAPKESITIKTEVEELENTSNTVNENIKIDDIRLAINIGDRFRFQRELFGGNGEVMNKTIAYLNQLAKYEEAVSFLNNKFGWTKDNQHAEDFLQIIRRRYL